MEAMRVKSKVYVLCDDSGRILRVDGGLSMNNIKDVSEWTLIDEGYGDKYNLCQSNYFDKPIKDMRGIYRYKLEDGKPVERTQEEMDAEFAARPPAPPSDKERIGALEEENKHLKEALELLLSGATEEGEADG